VMECIIGTFPFVQLDDMIPADQLLSLSLSLLSLSLCEREMCVCMCVEH
jgi:hypothetical protein